MNTIGQNLKFTIFGESHQKFIGGVIDGLPAGYKLPIELIEEDLKKRRPEGKCTTSRIEKDNVEFITGCVNGITDGSALVFIIPNNSIDSSAYEQGVLRPGHSDLGAYLKYGNNFDYRGGGMFSGRVTASIVVLGAICKDILLKNNTKIFSYIDSVGDVYEKNNDLKYDELYEKILKSHFAFINKNTEKSAKELIEKLKRNSDSVGGSIKTIILNPRKGIGEPYFNSIESYISSLIFSLGGVKGIYFSENNKLHEEFGSIVNDQYYMDNLDIHTKTNNNSGISGGIAIGEPIVFKTYIKPTPSIGKSQDSVNYLNGNIKLNIKGRHDSCIAIRMPIIIDALTSFAILDLMINNNYWNGIKI